MKPPPPATPESLKRRHVDREPESEAKLEVGILATPSFDSQLIGATVDRLESDMSERFSEFDWVFDAQQWPQRAGDTISEPSAQLIEAGERRSSAHWDFILVLTGEELNGHDRFNAFAVLSRSLDAALVSSAPFTDVSGTGASIANSLATLLQQALAHIAGLDAHPSPGNLMYRPERASDLHQMRHLETSQLEFWREQLLDIADQRLEEAKRARHPARFFFEASWLNRTEILRAVIAARPWQLPYRLGRLTAAAVSMLAIVIMTAESWDLAVSLSAAQLTLLAVCSLFTTSAFVASRQRLIPRQPGWSEQTVVTAVAAFLVVLAGLAIAWLVLAGLALLISDTLFSAEVIAGWAPATVSDAVEVGFFTRLRMAAFVASLSAAIGALGASFENQNHFQHVVFVDEEI